MKSEKNKTNLRIPYDSLTLRAVVAELRLLLVGGQVQDVRQPSPTDIQLGIRSSGRNFLLLLSCDSRFCRVNFSTTRLPNAPSPPTFCMALRKYLEGGFVQEVRQREFDRIFEIEVHSRNEMGERQEFILVAELMGKHSNLILLTKGKVSLPVEEDDQKDEEDAVSEETAKLPSSIPSDAPVIIDAAKRIGRRLNRHREILPGRPYLPPPAPAGLQSLFAPEAVDLFHEELAARSDLIVDLLADRLLTLYTGLSPFLAQEIAQRTRTEGTEQTLPDSLPAEELLKAIQEERYAPVQVMDREGHPAGAYPVPLVQIPPDLQTPVESLNFALEEAFATQMTRTGFEAVLGEVRAGLERERKRVERQKEAAERTLLEAERAEAHKQAGDLLLANLWQMEAGAREITVQDYFDPELPNRTLLLDPTLSPKENVERMFKRYRKARDGQEMALEYAAELEGTLERLKQASLRLAALSTEAEVRQLRTELLATGLIHSSGETDDRESGARAGSEFAGHKIRRFTTPDGYEILIGESATANDYLTTRLAAPNDIWLHVRAATSAHVIIRAKGKTLETIPRSVIEQAALLSVRHSGQKHSSLVPVDYTLRRNVRKPRKAPPGKVIYTGERTLHITP